jgi:hypothetical protein
MGNYSVNRSIVLAMFGLGISHLATAGSQTEMLGKAKEIIHALHLNGWFVLTSILATGLIGIIVAAIQRWDGPKIKVAVIILGVVTASLTYIANTMFPFNHKQYFARESKASSLFFRMQKIEDEFATAQPDQKDGLWRELANLYDQIESLSHENIEEKSSAKAASLGSPIIDTLITDAHAQSNVTGVTDVPSWVTTPPTSDDYYYFVGIADGYDLGVTKENAQWNARAHAQKYLNFQLRDVKDKPNANTTPITNQLLQLTKDADEYLAFDKETQTVRVYQLIGINKKSLERSAQYYANSAGYKNPGTIANVLVEKNKSWEQYYSTWTTTTNTNLDLYKGSMPPGGYTEAVRQRDKFMKSTIPPTNINQGPSNWR